MIFFYEVMVLVDEDLFFMVHTLIKIKIQQVYSQALYIYETQIQGLLT